MSSTRQAILLVSMMLMGSVYAGEFLNNAQKQDILNQIDSVCGDTWCEGEYNFSFDNIRCNSYTRSCVIDFKLIQYYYDGDSYEPTREAYYSTSCSIGRVDSYYDLVDVEGRYAGLNQNFYDRFSDCISVREGEAGSYL